MLPCPGVGKILSRVSACHQVELPHPSPLFPGDATWLWAWRWLQQDGAPCYSPAWQSGYHEATAAGPPEWQHHDCRQDTVKVPLVLAQGISPRLHTLKHVSFACGKAGAPSALTKVCQFLIYTYRLSLLLHVLSWSWSLAEAVELYVYPFRVLISTLTGSPAITQPQQLKGSAAVLSTPSSSVVLSLSRLQCI